MNFLLAIIKNSPEPLRVMSVEQEILQPPNLSDCVNYAPNYRLDEGQWYKLDAFCARSYNNPLICRGGFTSVLYNQIDAAQYKNMLYFVAKQNEYFLFQKIFPAQLYRKKWLSISKEPTLMDSENIIILRDDVDALYNKGKNTLYFKDLSRIKIMFNGIENLHKEATMPEVQSFINKLKLQLSDDYTADKVGIMNRKRIALANEKINSMSLENRNEMLNYIMQYCQDIRKTNAGQLLIDNERNLKNLLYGIDERFYTTDISNEKRLANSIITLS